MTAEAPLNERHRKLWTLHDFAVGRGLEIGPLHNTTVPRSMGEVYYADVLDREGLVAHYADEPLVDVSLIPEVDFVLSDDSGVPRPLSVAAADGAPYDWVMASHVIEHVPDLIGWLGQVADVVGDGGRLVLAVPDRRYTFDLHRPATTVGQLLQAHDLDEARPSVRAVFDHHRGWLHVDTPQLWEGRYAREDARRWSLDFVQEQVARARAGEYVDCHVWTFTPETLVDQVVELRRLGLCAWRVARLDPTPTGGHEFYAVLERLPRDQPVSEAESSEVETVRHEELPEWLRRDAGLRERVRSLERELAGSQARVGAARTRAEKARNNARADRERVERLRADLRSVKAARRRLRSRLDELERSRVVRLEAQARRAARRLLRRD